MIIIHTALLSNDPFGSKILTMDESECKLYIIYRSDEQLIRDFHPELGQHAFYILFGHEPMNRRRQAYIGQTQNALTRFEQHNSTKDFWECMCIFINTHEQFIRSEVQYLEYLGIKTAIECASFDLLENCQIPTEPLLKRDQIANIELYFNHVRLLLNYSGFYLFYKKQFDMESFTKKNHHKIVDRMIKQYNSIKDNSWKNYDDVYMEDDEEDITEIWRGDTWNMKVMHCKGCTYMLFLGGYIKPLENSDQPAREAIIKELIKFDYIREDNMYVNKFITCKNLDEAKLIVYNG